MGNANIASLETLVQQSRRQLSRKPMPAAVERYFEISIYLLIVTGFVTLASTGRLDAMSLLFVSAALLLRGYLLVKNRKLVIPQRWTSYFTLAYVLFYIADYYFLSGAFVAATVHLVLFSMVVKIFSVQRDRDHVYLAILSFLSVLAAAVLTVDSVFLAAFSIFMLLAVTTFISMEMKRSSAAAMARAREGGATARGMAFALSSAGMGIVFAVLVGAAAIFFILPRLSAGYLSNFAPQNLWVSGFSDNVQLGQIGEIKQSNTVVMHVQIEGDRGGTAGLDMKLRGVALAIFDGRRWSNPASTYIEQHASDGRFHLQADQVRLGNLPPLPGSSKLRPMFYRVTMEPLGTNVLFLAPVPTSFFSSIHDISLDEGGAVFNVDRGRMVESYVATSMVPEPDTAALRGSSGDFPAFVAVRYLQLPKLDYRIPALAQQITANATTDFDKAAALEQYLRTQYGYTLQMGYKVPRDPLAYFLFERKQGHCEYFASAMAVMLRTLGIPSRVVNGFRGAEYNDVTGNYIVRGRNAHSWVEAYISNYGWVSFDPTPPDPMAANTRFGRFLLYVDAAREFWREWVINYDFRHQMGLANTAVIESRSLYDRVRSGAHRLYEGLLARARRLQERASAAPKPWGAYCVGGVVGLILLFNARRIVRALRRFGLARKPETAPQAAASIWYARMTRTLARCGWKKLPSQTPQEFVATITDSLLAAPVADFTAHYERARFGDSAEDARRLPELLAQIRSGNGRMLESK